MCAIEHEPEKARYSLDPHRIPRYLIINIKGDANIDKAIQTL